MLQLLLVALAASAVVGDQAKPDNKPVESAPLQFNQHLLGNHEYSDHSDYSESGRNDNLYLRAKLDGPHGPREGPLIARNLHPSKHSPNIAEQDEIIKFVYSPVYYEPIWVLDYRFLKTGGRRYTRGPGGQVLILPKSYKHYKGDGTGDYDSLIEYWRLKMIAEQNKRNREHGLGHGHDHGNHGNHDGHGHDHGNHGNHEEYESDVEEGFNRGRGMDIRREPMYREREDMHRQREHMPEYH